MNIIPTEDPKNQIEKEDLLQYLLEAGIDPDTFPQNRELVIQELMMFNVIEKRRLQLNDIAKGTKSIHFSGKVHVN